MPIQPLSESDISAIGSSLVLNDARSVIKELIDNALDAQANTISIEISANTVDVIQVKDNGLGISGEDRQLLCKRGCTSKIRTIEDLERLGGSSLGFRGEALASVAGLSSTVVVTTKTDGELVGSASNFGHDGQLLSSVSASHPVGTTVRVQDFLKTIPVRRQTALKTASKTLSDIKKILQAYAFARPNTRITFKVFSAKSDKYNWTYGPSPSANTLLHAAAKIVGQEVAVRCEARLWTLNPEGQSENSHVIDAIVVKGEDDPTKIGNNGHFISIDGRPVSSTRGVFKDFVKLYKTYYRHWLSLIGSTDSSVDPFLCLHLRCPASSYDVNIEPAKDEVLFTDNRCVRNLLENFLKSVYGELPDKTDGQGLRNKRSATGNSQSQSFELLLAKRDHPFSERPKNALEFNQGPGVMRRSDGQDQKEPDTESETSAASGLPERGRIEDGRSAFEYSLYGTARPHRNMYDFDEDDLSIMEPPLPPEQVAPTEADDAELRKASVTNPWAIARLNATVSSARSPSSKVGSGTTNEQLMTPGPDSRVNDLVFKSHWKPFVPTPKLPSPARSDSSRLSPVYPNPGPPLRRRAPVRRVGEDDIEFTQESASDCSTQHHPTSLEIRATPKARDVQQPSFHAALDVADIDRRLVPRNDQGDCSNENAESEVQSTRLTDPVEEPDRTLLSRSAARKPSIPPLKTPGRLPLLHPSMKLTPIASNRPEQHSPTRPPWARNQDDGRSPSPASHAHPPPLSQSHRHPMESPPRLQPSPGQPRKSPRRTHYTHHPDLDEILDFEHRKKAVNAQRKNQSKLTNRHLNPAQLAQVQRESTASQVSQASQAPERFLFSPSAYQKQSQASLNVRDDTETSYDPPISIGTSVSDQNLPSSQEPVDNPSQKQSPHRNRYEAAKAALTRKKSPAPLSHAHPPTEPDPAPEAVDSTETLPRLPDEDPRAYLMQHRDPEARHTNGHGQNMMQGPTRTGLKFERTKKCKLPFESIPPTSATHNISARLPMSFPSLQTLSTQTRELGRVDLYPRTGKIHFVFWDPNSRDVPVWESSIVALVRKKYTAKVVEGEEVPANLQMRLGIALRAHCEELA